MNYEEKNKGYYSNVRLDLIGLLNSDEKGLKVLEIGAAYGETLFYLKEKGIASECVGVDLFEDVNNKHNYRKIDRFIFGNIEKIDLQEYHDYFDIILLPDVLEHLLEPKITLKNLQKLLKSEGRIFVSMPNIRHYSALIKIFFKGDFRYEESGIFDYTHIRFYCRKNIKELLETSGCKVIRQQSSIKNYPGKSLSKIFNLITFRIFEEFFSYQYFFVAIKNDKE